MEKAKMNYVKLFDAVVLDIAKDYEVNVLAAREKSEKLKVHIAKYMQLMENYEKTLELSCMQGFISSEVTKRRNNVAMMILNPEQHMSYIKAMSSKHWSNPLIKVSWEVEYVTAMVNYDCICANIDEMCIDIVNMLNDYPTEHLNDMEKAQFCIMRGRMIYNRGLLKMDIDSKESVTYFQQAETIFKSKELKSKQERKIYLADIYNCLGCIHYRQKETEKAIIFHGKALEGHSHNQNERHVTFLANIGACHFRLGIQHSRLKDKEQRKREMNKALKFYNDSITVAEDLRMDRTDIYSRTLKNRGDVLAMLDQYKEAKKDYQEGLDIVKTLYVSPSRKEILFLQAQGALIRKIIASKKRGKYY